MGANNLVIAVSNAASTSVISRDPLTYQIDDATLCDMLAQQGNGATDEN